jgi:hypothetical protein
MSENNGHTIIKAESDRGKSFIATDRKDFINTTKKFKNTVFSNAEYKFLLKKSTEL